MKSLGLRVRARVTGTMPSFNVRFQVSPLLSIPPRLIPSQLSHSMICSISNRRAKWESFTMRNGCFSRMSPRRRSTHTAEAGAPLGSCTVPWGPLAIDRSWVVVKALRKRNTYSEISRFCGIIYRNMQGEYGGGKSLYDWMWSSVPWHPCYRDAASINWCLNMLRQGLHEIQQPPPRFTAHIML